MQTSKRGFGISPALWVAVVFILEVWPESPLPGFALRERDVFQYYTA